MVATERSLSTEDLTEALTAVCAAAGLDPRGATLLRYLQNAVFRLRSAPVVVRIVGTRSLAHRVDKVVRIADWLAESGVPAVRLVSGIDQPVRVGPYLATVWHAVSGDGPRPRGRDLARVLRQVHALPVPAFPLPTWDPLSDILRRVQQSTAISSDERQSLLSCCALVEDRLGDLEFPLPRSVVHGDAHLGNLIPSAAGPVLCDFDSTCVGQPEWDLVPLAVGVLRFGEPIGRYRELCRAYGVDVMSWDGFPVLRALRELKIATSVLPMVDANPAIGPEMKRRLADVRHGNTGTRWRRYA